MTVSAPEPSLDQPYYGVPFKIAFFRFWQKGFTFTGRASRSEFWLSYVVSQGGAVVLYLLSLMFGMWALGVVSSTYSSYTESGSTSDPSTAYAGASTLGWIAGALFWFAVLYGLATIIPGLAITWRRLHDANLPGPLFFVALVPYAGEVAYLVLMALKTNSGGQRFDVVLQGYAPGAGSVQPSYSVEAQPASMPGGFSAASVGGDGFVSSTPAVPVPPVPVGLQIPPVPQPAVTPAMLVPPVLATPLVPPVPQPAATRPVPAPLGLPAVPAIPPVPIAPWQLGVPPVPAPAQPAGPIQAIPGVTPTAPTAPPAPVLSAVPVAPAVPMVPAVPTLYAAPQDDDLDSTRITPAARGQWHVTLPDGRQILVGSSLRMGRDPGLDPADPGALLVAIDDPAKSVSKTHAQLRVDGDQLVVTDLHSTNGTIVRTAGTSVVLAPEHPYRVTGDADVQIGDYLIQVRRG